MNSASTQTSPACQTATVTDPELTPSVTLEVSQVGRVRMDSRRRHPRPPRARVLRAYADWLSHQGGGLTQRSTSGPQPAVTGSPVPSRCESPVSTPSPSADSNALYYRIDVGPETTRLSAEGIASSPHFETRDYVPPAPDAVPTTLGEMPTAAPSDSIGPAKTGPRLDNLGPAGTIGPAETDRAETLSERDREEMPADGRPSPGVRNHIRELQSSGRLIGDLNVTRILESARIVPSVRRTLHGKPLTPSRRPTTCGSGLGFGNRRSDGMQSAESIVTRTVVSGEPQAVLHRRPRWPTVTDALLGNHRQAIETLGREVVQGLDAERNRIAVTSTRRREGCTTITLTLARWLARQGQRILLVDADLTHPDLQSLIGQRMGRSWSKAIKQSLTPNSIAHPSPDPSIEVISLGQISDNTGWSGPMLDCLGEWLRSAQSEYDAILINVGPVFQLVAELSHADRLFDTAILVNATNRTTADERIQSQNGLLSAGTLRLIVAQNFAPEPQEEPVLVG